MKTITKNTRISALIAALLSAIFAPQKAWSTSVRLNQQAYWLPTQVLRNRLLQTQSITATISPVRSLPRSLSQPPRLAKQISPRPLQTPQYPNAASRYRSPLSGSILTNPAAHTRAGAGEGLGRQPSRSFFSFFQEKIGKKIKDAMHSQLMEAIGKNDMAEAEKLIKSRLVDINALNQTTGKVALVEIAKRPISYRLVDGKEKSAVAWTQLFLELGANPNVADNTGTTPLMALASSAGGWSRFVVNEAVEVAELLIYAGADINYTNKGISIFDKAVFSGNSDVVTLLLDNPNLKVDFTGKQGKSLLFSAVKKNNVEIAQLLLERGAPVNGEEEVRRVSPFYINANRVSPLHIAAIRGNKTMVELLLKNGANPQNKDLYGDTPSDYAKLATMHVDNAQWSKVRQNTIYTWRGYSQPLSSTEVQEILNLLKNIRPETQGKQHKQQRTTPSTNETDQVAMKYVKNINKPNKEKEKGSSFQELALEYHPDVTKNDPKKQAVMIRINALRDIQKEFAQDLAEYRDKKMNLSRLKTKYNPAQAKNDTVLKELYKELSKQISNSQPTDR